METHTTQPNVNPHQDPATILEREARQWGMFIHFAQFGGFLAPLVGFILPIILWQIKKDQYPIVDVHGKIVVNWLLSCLIYGFAFGLLSFVLIGIPGLIVLFVLSVVYPIIGGIKANNGEVWIYPLSITFLR